MTCNDAYTCAIPCAIVEVVSKNFESLLVVIAKYKISMCVSVSVPSFMSKAANFVVNHVFDVVEWDKAAYQVAASPFQLWRARLPFHCPSVLCELLSLQ